MEWLVDNKKPFIEVGYYQKCKHGYRTPGDIFVSHRGEDGHIVCVLADGLGSGVKAGVLATLTATMAMKFVSSNVDIKKAAEIITSTLPVCSVRKIGYSTFTIADIRPDGIVNMIEYDNPPFVLINDKRCVELEKTEIVFDSKNQLARKLYFSSFKPRQRERLVLVSDGITQAGMGKMNTPLGWGDIGLRDLVEHACADNAGISARELSRLLVDRAVKYDTNLPHDDTTCAVINFRKPRKTLVLTGPPYVPEVDKHLAEMLDNYKGRKLICGGTTANIVARELGREIEVDLSLMGHDVPPASRIPGVDLVTEGTITLNKVLKMLKDDKFTDKRKQDAADCLAKYLLESDIIEFVVGTRINNAHQNPNLPVELDIRRNLIKQLVNVLKDKYLKLASYKLI